ncbi:helix-turn-helix domain-containing protein [Qipengyuania sp. YIM B01966]|uniref:helix-turn-helix domain-containing protein n=1 Tax=Qipengyuania sp. YIM B01966 TaxID=2778646 RepID=UPI0018F3C15B|nr:helix-turn-helix transcriptional regulator [Qipengyuania sp. YIM B01966]
MAGDIDSGDRALADSFGRCLTRQREAADISMSKLAELSGMSRAYIWRLEQGQTLPSLRNVARIAVALEMPVARLIEGLDTSALRLTNRDYDKPRD